MKKNKAAIGILGGMGPEASGYLYRVLIEKAISKFGAKNNDDFPEILLLSVPTPDFISNNDKKRATLKILLQKTKQLNQLDLACLSIACNTAHVLLEELQVNSKAPFISIIEEVTKKINEHKLKKVGLLATPSTLRFKLYQQVLEEEGIETIIPTRLQMKAVELVIRNVIAGKIIQSDTVVLRKISQDLIDQGAEGIILGCTELPLVFPKRFKSPIYNSVEILAESLLQKYYQQNTMETP